MPLGDGILLEYIIAIIIAIGIGILAAVLGVGGGFLMVPVFTILFGLDQKMAVGTSLAVIVATSFSGSFSFARQGRIFYRAAIVMIIPGIIGAVIGGLLTALLPGSWLALIFSGVIILFAVAMLSGDRTLIFPITFGPSFSEECRDRFSTCVTMRMYYLHLIIWGALSGLIGAVCGLGGGVINVPALFILGMPIHFAAASSTFIIFFTSLSGAAVHLALGHILPVLAVTFATGGFFGAQIGSRLAPRISAESLKKIIAVMFILIAVGTIAKTLYS
ncbi:MAG: sulfite exporter TauE/SafE family protein [Methanomicrobiales archaeon]